MNAITKNTSIQLGVVIVIIGGIVWLTDINSMASQANRDVQKLDDRVDSLDKKLDKLIEATSVTRDSVIRIEENLKHKYK